MKWKQGLHMGLFVLLALVLGQGQGFAAETAKKSVEEPNSIIELFLTNARKEADSGDYESAASLYQKVLSVDNQNLQARKEFAALIVKARLEDPHAEEESLFAKTKHHNPKVPLLPSEFPVNLIENAGLDLKDQSITFEALRVLTCIFQGRAEALKMAEALQAKHSGSPVANNLLGLAYAAKGVTEQARQHFQQALTQNAEFHAARLNLVDLDLQLGALNKAEKTLQEVLQKDENNRRACLAMAQICHLQGKNNEEKYWLHRAAKQF